MSSSSRIAPLDGLRAVSILIVLFSHAWLGQLIPGGLGVTVFFFISGFIITRLMIVEFEKNQDLRVAQFYGRRFFRLMPALVMYVIVSALVLLLAGKVMKVREVLAVFSYLANYYEIYAGFGDAEFLSPLAITWSLAVEEHFYLIFPSIFIFFAMHWRRFIGMIIFLMLVILLWRCWLVFGVGLEQLPHERLYKATDTRADSILFGVLLAILMVKQTRLFAILCKKRILLLGVCLLLVTLVIRSELFRESVRYSLQGIALLMIFPNAVFNNGVISSLLCKSFLQYTGRISYSLYLYHWLAYGIVAFWLSVAPMPVRMLTMIALAFVMADLSYRFVELPAMRFGRKFLKDVA